MLRPLLCLSLLTASPASAAIDFAHQVVPILKKHCAECHLGEKKKGGLSLNTREDTLTGSENGAVVKLGKADQSLLIEVLTSTDEDTQMPPKGARVSAAEIEVLHQWVNEGLVWEAGFSFGKSGYEPPLKPREVSLPAPHAGRNHAIDRILDSYAATHKQPLPPACDDATLVRRVHLDLIGLLPSKEVVQSFMADKSPNKRARLIESVLARDVDYAEHWLTMWNDLLRNDYVGTGYIDGGRKQITNWLYQSLVSNKPFDQFTRELIAPNGDSEGFINGIQWRGNVNASQVREVQFAQSISQVFLGINMKCASCHDSFIDRWKLDEAYGLAAIYAEQPLEINRCDKPTGRMAKAAWIFPELGSIDATQPKPERLKQLAALMTHRENGRFTRTIVNRLWHRLMGHGIVHPVDAMHTEPWSADLLDLLANQFTADGYDVKKMLAFIATSQAYQSQSHTAPDEPDAASFVYAGPVARRLTAEQFLDAVWQLTASGPGSAHGSVLRGKPDPSVKPAAEWIWSNDTGKAEAGETLTLRKIVKLAQTPTSAKIVVTADNEYQLFINNKLIGADSDLLSAETYAIAGNLRAGANNLMLVIKNGGKGPNPAAAYAEARLVFPDGKTEAITTDASWQWTRSVPNAKGAFTAAPNDWQSAFVCRNRKTWDSIASRAIHSALSQGGGAIPDYVRASLVTSNLLMRALGRPNREQIVTVRPENLTTLEAIDLANGNLLAGYLKQGAATLATKHTRSQDLIQELFLRLLSRPATQAETGVLSEIIGSTPTPQAVEDALWSVLLLPEFQFVR